MQPSGAPGRGGRYCVRGHVEGAMGMALVGTFGPGNTYSGRNVTWDAGVFTVEGLGEIGLDALRESFAAGQFAWASEETRAWAEGPATEALPTAAGAHAATTTQPLRGAFRFRPWMAVLVGVLVLAGVAIAIANRPQSTDGRKRFGAASPVGVGWLTSRAGTP